MGCWNRIFKMRPDERFVQGEKNTLGKGREESFKVKQNTMGFTGSADNIIFSLKPGI